MHSKILFSVPLHVILRIFNQRLLIKFIISINVLTTTYTRYYMYSVTFYHLTIIMLTEVYCIFEKFQNEILTYASKRHLIVHQCIELETI